MNEPLIERRRYPRADVEYKAVLETASGGAVNLRTQNISGSGIYFYVEKKLTEFTEVSLTVSLPPAGKVAGLSFQCSGVIVRVEDREGDPVWPYAAAVHFTGVDEKNRVAICDYVTAVSAGRKGGGRR